jgi:DNA-binding MarR family transcriptional regulator
MKLNIMTEGPSQAQKDYNHQLLDKVIHARIRFAALAYLLSVGEASFVELRDSINATDGNLSIHLRKLEAAGYIECIKQFQCRKPLTNYRVTELGREAFVRHRQHIDMFYTDMLGYQAV